MFDRAALKRDVRDMLRGNWGNVFLTLLLWSLAVIAMQMIASVLGAFTLGVVSFAVSLLVVSPLTVSLYRYMSLFFRQQQPQLGEAFSGFSNFGPNVGAMFWRDLWLFIWGLPAIGLFIIGGAQMGIGAVMWNVVRSASDVRAYGALFDALSYGMTGVGVVCFLLGYVAMILPMIKTFSYYLVPYLIGEYPDLDMRECLNLSKRIMHGHKWELFVFQLSFLLWGLLVTVTCGIALIYVGPYISVAEAAYYDHVKNLALDTGVIQPSELHGGMDSTVDYL